MTPNITKVNHRYRGPLESEKQIKFKNQIDFNLNKIREKLEHLETLKDNILIDKNNSINKLVSGSTSYSISINDSIDIIVKQSERGK